MQDVTVASSVADPGCLSRIPDPDFYPSRIPNPGSKNSNKIEGWKKNLLSYLFCSHKSHKIENNFIFKNAEEKILANFQKDFLLKYLSVSSQKYGVGIQVPVKTYSGFRIPDPGSRGQKGTGSRIRIRNTCCETTKYKSTDSPLSNVM